MAGIARVVALGASNLTRGFHEVVSASRAAWGPGVQILAALGHGRSYGACSALIARKLPGILQSGLWQAVESMPAVPTRALITDVGNDILYGYSPEQTLVWVEEALDRLQRITRDIVLTDLPLVTVSRLSEAKYVALRSVLYPFSRLPMAEALKRGEAVSAGLVALATARGARFLRLDPTWYGFDPIHIRRSCWPSAWRQLLDIRDECNGYPSPRLEGLKLLLMPPERRWILGVERFTPQSGIALRSGGRVWLY
jgi:hypothetical protein